MNAVAGTRGGARTQVGEHVKPSGEYAHERGRAQLGPGLLSCTKRTRGAVGSDRRGVAVTETLCE